MIYFGEEEKNIMRLTYIPGNTLEQIKHDPKITISAKAEIDVMYQNYITRFIRALSTEYPEVRSGQYFINLMPGNEQAVVF